MTDEDELLHYGTLRKSGRYPWGSGNNPTQRSKMFVDYVDDLLAQGLTPVQIAKGLSIERDGKPLADDKFTTTQLRATRTIANATIKAAQQAQAQRLKEKQLSNVAIGKVMGLNESSVRALLAPGAAEKTGKLEATAQMLRDQVEKKKYLDFSTGTKNHMGVSQTQLNTAVALLKEEGYKVHYVKIKQLGTGLDTHFKVLSKDPYPKGDLRYEIKSFVDVPTTYTNDHGRSFLGILDPISISSRRIGVNYKEDGGADADGVIWVRPGAKNLDMGGKQYAQVRIMVDKSHYLKGMAVLKDDLPDGVDLVFNTNKSNTGNKLDAMKPLKTDKQTGELDPDNPFGSVIHQLTRVDRGGKAVLTSAMNIVNDEEDWYKWSKSLSSQALSKQAPALAKKQLELALNQRQEEFNEIMKLTNPAVKKKLLDAFADGTDAAAVHLKAAALPGQRTHVILPVNAMKDTEIYAPNYQNGEKVVLIRHPHGGKFEIPELTVNNRNPEAKKLLGNATVAVGINAKVAQRLSGADFDGDTVLVIPNKTGVIKTHPALEELKNFDPQTAYPFYEGMKPIGNKQTEMGKVSNLITDMTIRGAPMSDIARAVKHSMVVIDADKHKLNYRQSYIDNGIAALKKRYQSSSDGKTGASTLISRAKSRQDVPDRKPRSAKLGGAVDPKTGKKMYELTGKTYLDKDGNVKPSIIKSKKLAETDDAFTLVSENGGTLIESVYANHSNKLKALANNARKASLSTKDAISSPSATKVYAHEVGVLNAKLNAAKMNAPLERQAQLLANKIVAAKKAAHPEMERADIKKIEGQALQEARKRIGATKQKIVITNDEWNAIQAGAVSKTKLNDILANADLDKIKELATPRVNLVMTPAKQARADSLLALGYTQAEVAAQLGIPVSTLNSSILRKE